MFAEKRYSPLRIFAAITFILMVVVNGLANALPINGQTTGEVSDTYPNLFAPAGYTFGIWIVIYILLLVYTVYQLGVFKNSSSRTRVEILDKVSILFAISSIANSVWIFAWHYNIIWLSLILMVVILTSLIFINRELKERELTIKEKVFVKLPFSVYFGWITVATIANVTTFLVSIDWDGFGIAENIWTIIVLLIGFLISTAVIVKDRNIVYGLTIIWAYTGILVKHSNKSGFDAAYPSVISSVSICIAFLFIIILYTLFSKEKKNPYY